MRCPKTDYWPLETPTIHTLSAKYCQLRVSHPGVPIHGTKLDIDAAFTRCRLRPDAAALFGTEFELGPALADNVICFYLVLHFGFTGSPGIFGSGMQGAQRYHRLHAPPLPSWNGTDSFSAEVFVDDGMFLEAWVGNHSDTSVSVWGDVDGLFFGEKSISEKKMRDEGMWSRALLLVGFRIDLHLNTISLPPPKILGACNLINSPSLGTGCYVLDLHIAQGLRGCINHWACTGRIWRWLAEPVNSLLAMADTNQMWARCNDQAKWGAFWSVVQFIRDITKEEHPWPTLFSGIFPTSSVCIVKSYFLNPTDPLYGFG